MDKCIYWIGNNSQPQHNQMQGKYLDDDNCDGNNDDDGGEERQNKAKSV